MTESTSIYDYDPKIHERYAEDQVNRDPLFPETPLPPFHLDELTTVIPGALKSDILLGETNQRRPFAAFSPPSKYKSMKNRFFAQGISLRFNWPILRKTEDETPFKLNPISSNKSKTSTDKASPFPPPASMLFSSLVPPSAELKDAKGASYYRNLLESISLETTPAGTEQQQEVLFALISQIEEITTWLDEANGRKHGFQPA